MHTTSRQPLACGLRRRPAKFFAAPTGVSGVYKLEWGTGAWLSCPSQPGGSPLHTVAVNGDPYLTTTQILCCLSRHGRFRLPLLLGQPQAGTGSRIRAVRVTRRGLHAPTRDAKGPVGPARGAAQAVSGPSGRRNTEFAHHRGGRYRPKPILPQPANVQLFQVHDFILCVWYLCRATFTLVPNVDIPA